MTPLILLGICAIINSNHVQDNPTPPICTMDNGSTYIVHHIIQGTFMMDNGSTKVHLDNVDDNPTQLLEMYDSDCVILDPLKYSVFFKDHRFVNLFCYTSLPSFVSLMTTPVIDSELDSRVVPRTSWFCQHRYLYHFLLKMNIDNGYI